LWEIAQPLIPQGPWRIQGGGRRRVDDRALLAAILYMAKAGGAWSTLPEEMFGVSRATTHRRFTEWTAAGLWPRLHRQVLKRLGARGGVDLSRAVVDSVALRAVKKGI
jgi:transposase